MRAARAAHEHAASPCQAPHPRHARAHIWGRWSARSERSERGRAGWGSPHPNNLGTPETITDATGAVTHQDHTPFGTPGSSPSLNGFTTQIGFTGQPEDADLGLTDMGGRIYDPLAGRFTTADPIMQAPFGLTQGQNRYAYVFNDPINMTDPTGFTGSGNGTGRDTYDSTIGNPVGAIVTEVGIASAVGYLGSVGGPAWGGGVGVNLVTDLILDPGAAQSGYSYKAAAPSAAPRSMPTRSMAAVANARGAVAPLQVQEEIQGGYAPQGAAPNAGASPQAPFVKDGRITEAGRKILRRSFDRYNFDVGQIKVILKHNLGQAGITLGNRVYLDDRFQYLSPYRQARLLGHEITHSVQYRDLGKANFLERYASEYRLGDDINYGVPIELWAVPTERLSVTQSGSFLGPDGLRHDFTLDNIADRIGIETAAAVPYTP